MKTIRQRMKTIDIRAVLDGLEAAVAQRGHDYIYTDPDGNCPPNSGCVNWWHASRYGADHEGPACIVGYVLHHLGVDMSRPELDTGTAQNVSDTLLFHHATEITPAALLMLKVAQSIQDKGGTWGMAWDAAHQVYEFFTRITSTEEESDK